MFAWQWTSLSPLSYTVTMKQVNKIEVWQHCKDDGQNFKPELTAYINSEGFVYIHIEDKAADHMYNLEFICLDADTAEDFAKSLLKIVRVLRNG